jgi:hypothetical protein
MMVLPAGSDAIVFVEESSFLIWGGRCPEQATRKNRGVDNEDNVSVQDRKRNEF